MAISRSRATNSTARTRSVYVQTSDVFDIVAKYNDVSFGVLKALSALLMLTQKLTLKSVDFFVKRVDEGRY